MNRIHIANKDALDFLGDIDDGSVDVIITDPPYWTLDRWRQVGTTTRLGGHREQSLRREDMWFPTIDQDYLWQCFLEFDRVLKLDGHLYIFADDRVSPILMHWIREARDEHRFGDCHALVWDKVSLGMGYHYRRRYEHIVFAWREKREGVKSKSRKLADPSIPDVLVYNRITGGYPTEKPEGLLRILVKQSARAGDVLLDPFAGSGSLAAAVPDELGCTILLNDISEAAIRYMEKRFRIVESLFPPDGIAVYGR